MPLPYMGIQLVGLGLSDATLFPICNIILPGWLLLMAFPKSKMTLAVVTVALTALSALYTLLLINLVFLEKVELTLFTLEVRGTGGGIEGRGGLRNACHLPVTSTTHIQWLPHPPSLLHLCACRASSGSSQTLMPCSSAGSTFA